MGSLAKTKKDLYIDLCTDMCEEMYIAVFGGMSIDGSDSGSAYAACVYIGVHVHAGMQACRHAGEQACRHAGMQACRCAGMHLVRNACCAHTKIHTRARMKAGALWCITAAAAAHARTHTQPSTRAACSRSVCLSALMGSRNVGTDECWH